MTVLYKRDDDGIRVLDGRKSFDVDIPAYVYDLWMPLIGSDAVGIYGFLCRLAMSGKVSRLGVKKLAKACHIGDKTFTKQAILLRDCGFIRIKTPKEEERKRGVSTIYTVLDAPRDISFETINSYTDGNPESYQPITWWFIDPEDQEVEIPKDDDEKEVSSNDDTVSSNDDNSIDPLVDPFGC